MNIIDNLKSINEMSERRLAICEQCDLYNSMIKQCKKCGCFMLAKSRFPSARCPLNKWPDEEEINT